MKASPKFVFLAVTCLLFAVGRDQPIKKLFTIVISMDQPAVKTGSNVEITVRLTNNSNQNLDASGGISNLTGLDPNYLWDVRDSAGKLVPLRPYEHPELATGFPVNRTIKPGETLTEAEVVSRLYDMTRPGEYTIQVSRRVSDNPKDGVVKSNKIKITVTAPIAPLPSPAKPS